MFTNFIKSIMKRLVYPIVESILDNEFDKRLIIADQMREFENADKDVLASNVEAQTDIEDLVSRLKEQGIPVIEKKVDIDDFEQWGEVYSEIRDNYTGDVKIEKPLEHYLTMKYLEIKSEDVFIDIAAASSPWAQLLRKKYGMTRAYRQDLIYKDGINGIDIGGNAGNMALPDGFADILTLHCAYECFQGDSDKKFAKEVGRVLRQGGRLGIVPLYLDNVYFVKSGPKADKRFIDVEKEAKWIWRDDVYLFEPFSRHYSPESFRERVFNNLKGMKSQIIHFTNLSELEEHYKGQRIYCNFMFKAVKDKV